MSSPTGFRWVLLGDHDSLEASFGGRREDVRTFSDGVGKRPRSLCSYLYVVRGCKCGQDFLGFRLRGDGVFGCQLDGQVKKSCGQRLQSFVKILAWSGLGKIVLTS